ncbi:MAG: RluA family pseudouridine synthase [Clostridia bacterium]|nr:RluA family pseudouridine synthase [Clostridia bacterium]
MREFTMEDIPILFEDNHIIVVAKPQYLPSQADSSEDADLLTILKAFIKERDGKANDVYLGLVHRLDRVTGGVMVLAKTSKAASRLSEAIRNREVEKKYLAVILGSMREKQGVLSHYLKKHSANNIVYVATQGTEGAKLAELNYKELETVNEIISLEEIQLQTGRSHQIRVQFSAIGHPLFGDHKYGGDKLAEGFPIALWAVKLSFVHPVTKTNMVFVCYPPEDREPWKKFDLSGYFSVFKGSIE